MEYPDSFDTRDRTQDLQNLKLAVDIGITDPELLKVVQAGIARALVEDTDELNSVLDNINDNSVDQQPEE